MMYIDLKIGFAIPDL